MRNVFIGILALMVLTGCGGSISQPLLPPSAGSDVDLGSEIRHTRQWIWSQEYLGNLQGLGIKSHTPIVMTSKGESLTIEIQLRVPKANAAAKIDQFLNETMEHSTLEAARPFLIVANLPQVSLEKITVNLPETRKDLDLILHTQSDVNLSQVWAKSISLQPAENAFIQTLDTHGILIFEAAEMQEFQSGLIVRHQGPVFIRPEFRTAELQFMNLTGEIKIESCRFEFGSIRRDGQPLDVPTCL